MRLKFSALIVALSLVIPGLTTSAHAVSTPENLINDLIVLHEDGEITVKVLAAPLSADQATAAANKLTKAPDVKVAVPNVEIKLINAVQTVVGTNPNLWGLDRSDQGVPALDEKYHYGATGKGIPVYVVDTGLNTTHNDFSGRVGIGRNFFADSFDQNYSSSMQSDAYGSNSTVTDCNGHGTHVSGTAAGTRYGIAKQATIIPVRVFGCGDTGSLLYLVNGLEWIIETHVGNAPAVVNMSLGEATSDLVNTLMGNLVGRLISENITVVAASGNENADACYSSPANIPSVITVNALATDLDINNDRIDTVPEFSNWGTCTDIYAPGVDISSAWIDSNTSTAKLQGTSMASPHIAGVAARILQYNPTFTPAQVSSLLIAHATTQNLWAGQDDVGDTHKVLHFDDEAHLNTPVVLSADVSAADGTALLSWTQSSDLAELQTSDYKVMRNGQYVTCVTVATRSCRLSNVDVGVANTVDLIALIGGMNVLITTSDSFVPYVETSAPVITGGVPKNGSVTVSWRAPSTLGTGPITGYTVRTVGGAQVCTTTSELQCTVTSLTNGVPYQFEVIAHTQFGDTSASTATTAVTPRTVASSVRSVSAAVTGKKKTKVTWSTPSTNGGARIVKYQYCLSSCTKSSSWISTGLTRYVVITSKKGTTRTINIRALNAAGASKAVKKTFKQTK